jgi:hypothetical protein
MSHTYAEEESPQRIVKTRSLRTERRGRQKANPKGRGTLDSAP